MDFVRDTPGWLLDRGGPWWAPTLGHCRWFDLSRGHWRNGITFAMLPLGEVSGIPSELSLERSGSHLGLVKRFFEFLCTPKNWGRIPVWLFLSIFQLGWNRHLDLNLFVNVQMFNPRSRRRVTEDHEKKTFFWFRCSGLSMTFVRI